MVKTLCFCLLFSPLLAAQNPPAEPGPQISFSKDLHSFGVIEKGEKVTVEFPFKNTGDQDLIIEDVKTSCGCTTAKPNKSVFKPGEGGVIPVTFDSGRFAGSITKTITVVSNDAVSPKKQLKIQGDVQAEIVINPTNLSLYNISRHGVTAREIRVSTAKLEQLQISNLQSDLDFVQLELKTIDPKSAVIHFSFKGEDLPKDSDSITGTVSFNTNSSKSPKLDTLVFIRVSKPIRVSPALVSFYASPKGKPRETTIALSSPKNEAFKILNISSDLDFIKAELVDEQKGKLRVQLTETQQEGKFQGAITVKTDLAELPEIQIPVRGSFL